ncbi:MAG: tRNA uridine-5-carboxymethylaminomethyl(34) synthesis GTPase MnmE [Ignavibacteriae bacterium]|nr:tRNA uridine-5-carboxymethylaminomethyl(34) synthesis GTPase MnmE [Ignavibacteriota bacterium]
MTKTITALATPPGVGGIAVIRISGDNAIPIVDSCFSGKIKLSDAKSHTVHYGNIQYENRIIDTVTAAVFRSPNSYTGEDIVEISCHGGMVVASEIIELIISLGAVQAEAGEFTKRAFLNGKIDLTQVEAVADIIHSLSVPGCMTAARQLTGEFTARLKELRQKLLDIASLLELELDFSDEDIEFTNREKIKLLINETRIYCNELADSYKSAEILRSGFFVAIAGYPNSGKSTLFNTLLQRNRAIVSEIPGTTRDYLEEMIYINGLAIRLTDTAGLRPTENIIEIEGIKLVESVLEQSDLILIINDLSISPDHSDKLLQSIKSKYKNSTIYLLQNKIDKVESSIIDSLPAEYDKEIRISAKAGVGIDSLKEILENEASQSIDRTKDILVNQRHSLLLKQCSSELENANSAIDSDMENEIIAIEIRSAAKTLGEITGDTWDEDVLNNIFSRFCIGK